MERWQGGVRRRLSIQFYLVCILNRWLALATIHFFKHLFLALFFIALHDFGYREAIVHLILLRALFGVTFELFFKYIFASKL